MLKVRRKSAMIRAPFLRLTCPGGLTTVALSKKCYLSNSQVSITVTPDSSRVNTRK